ncbi:MAG: VOC family protein [Gemmatimonadota bacterium]|nr:VOC family protein [Gemmatimonadota bacterium]
MSSRSFPAGAPGSRDRWSVDDIGKKVKGLQKMGVTFARYTGMEQYPLGIWTSPSGARIAWFKDPDGNVLSLSQH